jgi:hypothetical protein
MSYDQSNLGRWTECTISGKQNRHITIITAYNVCNDSIITCGPKTAYSQQYHQIKLHNPGSNPDPRQQFWNDLKMRIETLTNNKNEVIIMLDANDSLQNQQSFFTTWVRSLQLIDIHLFHHGTEEEPASYVRGSLRIDYILATKLINNYVTQCGMLPFHELCLSDHRPLYANIDLSNYLGHFPPPPPWSKSRDVSTADPRTVVNLETTI